MLTGKFTTDPGLTLFAFPRGADLATYVASVNRIALPQDPAPNLGRYSYSLDPEVSRYWGIFSGATQPANWGAEIGLIDLEDGAINVLPSLGYGARDVASDVIEIATDAARTIARAVVDEDEDPVTLPGSCEFVITDSNKALVTKLTPTISGNSYSVTLPRSILKQEQDLFFALRNADSTKLDFDSGVLRVVYVAFDPT